MCMSLNVMDSTRCSLLFDYEKNNVGVSIPLLLSPLSFYVSVECKNVIFSHSKFLRHRRHRWCCRLFVQSALFWFRNYLFHNNGKGKASAEELICNHRCTRCDQPTEQKNMNRTTVSNSRRRATNVKPKYQHFFEQWRRPISIGSCTQYNRLTEWFLKAFFVCGML